MGYGCLQGSCMCLIQEFGCFETQSSVLYRQQTEDCWLQTERPGYLCRSRLREAGRPPRLNIDD